MPTFHLLSGSIPGLFRTDQLIRLIKVRPASTSQRISKQHIDFINEINMIELMLLNQVLQIYMDISFLHDIFFHIFSVITTCGITSTNRSNSTTMYGEKKCAALSGNSPNSDLTISENILVRVKIVRTVYYKCGSGKEGYSNGGFDGGDDGCLTGGRGGGYIRGNTNFKTFGNIEDRYSYVVLVLLYIYCQPKPECRLEPNYVLNSNSRSCINM
ncbi:hypothetical protein HZH66_012923 [Vespula vulgaris]|uniref:Uncharacterized protein n=1 Tax=Vespula vulgaris TaxID=7454 RepID=A0A834J8C7_VESVU|nr:hypothetical protein HZH66_012923 [Vespula vulgaris]